MSQSLKVLIVQDSTDDAEALVQELRKAGFEPDWQRVDTEADYLDQLQNGINLVLSDYQMPQFSGLRALQLLKQGGLDVPFILVSGVPGEDTAVAAMKQGAADYLIKTRLDTLGQSVAQALDATRQRAERRRVEQRLTLQGTALETAANGIVITDVAGKILWSNAAFSDQSGFSLEEAIGQTLRLLKSGKHSASFYQDLWAVVLAGKTWRGQLTNRHKNGSLYLNEHTITPVRSSEGAVTHFVVIMDDVTERRAADVALATAHTQLNTLLDHSPAVLFALSVVDGIATPRFSSGNITQLLGFSTSETLGMNWWLDVLHPDDRQRALTSIPRTLTTGRSWAEYRVRHKDGSHRWVEENMRLICDRSNEPAEIAGVWTDVTERKETEGALMESERRLREILENVRLIALVLDRAGVVTFCNSHLEHLTGWRCDEFIGSNWFEKFLPESEVLTRKLFFETIDTGEFPSHHENPIQTKAGESRQIAWNNTLLRAPDGSIVGIASIGEDITDRRKATADLQASEERFRQVVENILEVFWMTDVKTNRILYVSPGYEKIWGRSCESLLGSSKGWLEQVHGLDRARVENAAAAQLTGKYDENYRIVRPDGTLRWVHSRAFPVKDKSGAVSRVVGIAEDITERKNLEEQFLRGQRLECIGMLAAGIAHDLNNVLAPIGMAAPILRTERSTPAELKVLAILEQCADRGAGLVRQILGFVHGIGGEPRLVQVKHLLEDITGVISETFPKSIVLREEIPAGLWPVVANPTQIHQVLLNLCVNARDAMPQGGTLVLHAENIALDETAAEGIEGARPGNWLLLGVKDTGTGIPAAVLSRIWEPFFTTKLAKDGTGLGLSTVRGIVNAHNGFIVLETEAGRGTSFFVYLPADAAAVAVEAPAASPPGERGHGELILLVDDEEHIRDTANSILTQAGYRMLLAADGPAGLRLIDAQPAEFALVISDRDMPLGGGAHFARGIRARNPAMKILLISGLSKSEDNAETTHENFADDFIAKPFSSEVLLRAVSQLLVRKSVST